MTSNQTVIQISMMECKSHCRQEQGYTMEGTILLNRHIRVGSEIHFRDTDNTGVKMSSWTSAERGAKQTKLWGRQRRNMLGTALCLRLCPVDLLCLQLWHLFKMQKHSPVTYLRVISDALFSSPEKGQSRQITTPRVGENRRSGQKDKGPQSIKLPMKTFNNISWQMHLFLLRKESQIWELVRLFYVVFEGRGEKEEGSVKHELMREI